MPSIYPGYADADKVGTYYRYFPHYYYTGSLILNSWTGQINDIRSHLEHLHISDTRIVLRTSNTWVSKSTNWQDVHKPGSECRVEIGAAVLKKLYYRALVKEIFYLAPATGVILLCVSFYLAESAAPTLSWLDFVLPRRAIRAVLDEPLQWLCLPISHGPLGNFTRGVNVPLDTSLTVGSGCIHDRVISEDMTWLRKPCLWWQSPLAQLCQAAGIWRYMVSP